MVYAYADNYLDLKHTVIMDFEATITERQADVTAAEMIAWPVDVRSNRASRFSIS